MTGAYLTSTISAAEGEAHDPEDQQPAAPDGDQQQADARGALGRQPALGRRRDVGGDRLERGHDRIALASRGGRQLADVLLELGRVGGELLLAGGRGAELLLALVHKRAQALRVVVREG